MNQKIDEPRTMEEKTVWILNQMMRSSKIREKYFKHINDYNSQYIVTNIEPDLKTGIPKENREIYDAIHADFIFRVLGVIESFQGAMTAAWIFSESEERDFEIISSILVNPKGQRRIIRNLLKEGSFTEEATCRLFAIPTLSYFDEETAINLKRILEHVFHRVMSCAWYSEYLLNEYKDIRNVYAHNFRFIFIGNIETEWKLLGDESILGFLKNPKELAQGMAYIGAIQRVVMGDLVSLLSELERWIYNNLKVTILNNCKPVLPPYIPYLNKNQQREYERIWKAQGYKYYGPPMEVRGPLKVGKQILLLVDFLGVLDRWKRSLRVYGKDGKVFRFPVKKIQQILEKRLEEIQSDKKDRPTS